MNPGSRQSVRLDGARYSRTVWTLRGMFGSLVLSAWVTPLCAQGTGQPLAPPIVHELRSTVPSLSQATLNAPTATATGVWTSSVDAVTNVAIDVLLLPPDLLGPEQLRVRTRDVDGYLRSWSEGPVLVARALMPGRHNLVVQWEAAGMSDAELARATAGVQTFTRPALTGSGALMQASPARPAPVSETRLGSPVLVRIAPR
jgi:hypothetical protein